MKHTLLAAIAALTIALTPVVASAAPAAPTGCQATAFRQHDLAGVYVSSTMRLEVFACGGSWLGWSNAYGDHFAVYASTIRLPGGGVGAVGINPGDVGYLDNTTTLGVKPAEVGFVQVFTVDQYSNVVGVYRLKQIG